MELVLSRRREVSRADAHHSLGQGRLTLSTRRWPVCLRGWNTDCKGRQAGTRDREAALSFAPLTGSSPKGAASQCPGLRGTSYPGYAGKMEINPERVVSRPQLRR